MEKYLQIRLPLAISHFFKYQRLNSGNSDAALNLFLFGTETVYIVSVPNKFLACQILL